MPNTNNPDINSEFSNLIREQMTPDQFWNFVRSYHDKDFFCEEAEEWDKYDKKDAIENFKLGNYNYR